MIDIELLDTEQAAKILGVTAGTLTVRRCVKRYPLRYVRIRRKIRYRRDDLVKFIESRTMSGISEARLRPSNSAIAAMI